MAKDPAFLFYPGDYLKDTQCLSEKSQVAYDRIMCEHMRNICISKKQLDFFTKRLTEDEKSEVMATLTPVTGGFQITWVAESICKRKAYSDSRRKNKQGRRGNISSTYDQHMENANAIENVNGIVKGNGFWEKEEAKVYPIEKCLTISMNDDRWVRANSTGQPELERFNQILEQMGVYEKNPADYKKHFSNLKKKFPESVKPQAKVYSIDELREMAKTATW